MGNRKYEDAAAFMVDLRERLSLRIQLTTDGHGGYPNAVSLAFRHNIDFAELVKQYASPREGQARYSPAIPTGSRVRVDRGNPTQRESAQATSSARTSRCGWACAGSRG